MAEKKSRDGTKQPIPKLPATTEPQVDPDELVQETFDFTGEDAEKVTVVATKNIALTMLKTLGAPIPSKVLRGRIEKKTRITLGKGAADYLLARKYVRPV